MPHLIRRNVSFLAVLIGLMLMIKAFDVFVSPNHIYPGRTAAFPWIEIALTGGAGLVGAVLAARSPAVKVWPEGPHFALPALGLGLALGVALAAIDAWLRIGDINVGLPLAPLFYLWGGISQEVLTHFAPVALVIGLLSFATASQRAQAAAFWAVALAMSVIAALGMMSAFQNPDIPLSQSTSAAPMVIGAAVLVIELALFAMMWARGLAASLLMRLGFYAVWHIAWPALAY